jgi:hypothetical protein
MRRPTLAKALHKVSGKAERIPPFVPLEEESTGRSPSRVGKRLLAGHFDPAVVRQVKQLALDRDSTIQGCLGEALNELFVKYRLKPIA